MVKYSEGSDEPFIRRNVKKLAVFTSGGDSPGMNAAVRAVVRNAIARNLDVYAIYEGYQGMIDGGTQIRKMTWTNVSGILQKGGTILGTARCKDFREREGRKKATFNLVSRGIDNLICIGGDGSLTGADRLRSEWKELIGELVKEGKIDSELLNRHPSLHIVGMVGSIDNDMVGTEMTIGCDTSLHRIVQALDWIATTASSHRRIFIVEVMGRDCGWLCLMSSVVTGADWIFIPEQPPPQHWKEKMIQELEIGRKSGKRSGLIIVAEGARDRQGNPITCDEIKKTIDQQLEGSDVRVTTLGHIQRGGNPTAFDRYMSTVLGANAVDCLIEGKDDLLIGMNGYSVTTSPLMECVKKTKKISELIAGGEYDSAVALRDSAFQEMTKAMGIVLLSTPPGFSQEQLDKGFNIGVMNCGASAPGMNAAIRVLTRLALGKGHKVKAIRNGFQGFARGEIEDFNWFSVSGWAPLGGAFLGTNRHLPDDLLDSIAHQIEKHGIQALVMVGGFEGYRGIISMNKNREKYPAFRIPMICIPATISNNTPASDVSIGMDKALNNLVEATDNIKQSAIGYVRRIFIVEVMGSHCGFLAMMGAIISGAENVYLPEEGIRLSDLTDEVSRISDRFTADTAVSLYIRNESSSDLYTTEFITKLFDRETPSDVSVRQSVLGHLQQGGNPTPLDRINAARMATSAIEYLDGFKGQEISSISSVCIGIKGAKISRTPLQETIHMMDFKKRRPSHQWWRPLRAMFNDLARSPASLLNNKYTY